MVLQYMHYIPVNICRSLANAITNQQQTCHVPIKFAALFDTQKWQKLADILQITVCFILGIRELLYVLVQQREIFSALSTTY